MFPTAFTFTHFCWCCYKNEHVYPEKQKSSSFGFVAVEIKKTDSCSVENIIMQVTTRMWCASAASLMSSNC